MDIGAEQTLDFDGALRGKHVRCSVHMRLEAYALLADLAQLAQRHDLESARVGEDWPVPAHEGVQPAKSGDAFSARAQHQVIGIGEHDISARCLDLLGIQRLYGRSGANRHKRRSADDAARRCNLAEPGRTVLCNLTIAKPGHHILHVTSALSFALRRKEQAGITIRVESIS